MKINPIFNILRRKSGSSAVFLALAFTAFAICIAGSIGICRRLAVKSECEAFGRVWTRAVLSEYDNHLIEDYGIMAYWGGETEVNSKIDSYISYSSEGKLDAVFSDASSELTGYELGDPDNFKEALRKAMAGNAAESILGGGGRQKRADVSSLEDPGNPGSGNGDDKDLSFGKRTIGNSIVLETLPSKGTRTVISVDSLTERARSLGSSGSVRSAVTGAGTEVLFIWQHFGSNTTSADDKDSYFRNEIEYIVGGKPGDEENLRSCRRRLFLMRNALNLAALYKDPEKMELILSAAELITPGPLGAATQLIIAEAWAAAETESDLKDLYKGERVPVLKRADQWKTDLSMILGSDDVRKKLDEESRQLMDENSEELRELTAGERTAEIIKDGLDYDEYLMLMVLTMNERVRLLRIMDLVDINMKYRYYRDFNLMEYYTGVRFTFKANGREYSFGDSYR